MSMLYRDHGIVLRTYKLGESDRIVSFMTERHGKVRAVAKGVRKTKSRFGARLEPTSHVAIQLYEGRELDIVTQAESVDHFRELRDDLDRLTRAVSMLEAVDQMSLEGEPNARLYQMLLGALRTLATEGLVAFDLTEGGLLCLVDRRGAAVSAEAVGLLQDILGGRLTSALAEPRSAATNEVDHLATRALEQMLERRLRSIGLLDRG
jgi:DNA repair protein RecO (recombination protein O)